jgi:hypothetical protein
MLDYDLTKSKGLKLVMGVGTVPKGPSNTTLIKIYTYNKAIDGNISYLSKKVKGLIRKNLKLDLQVFMIPVE